MKKKEARSVLRTPARHNYNLLSIALKLIVALSLVDIIGFIQIRKKNPSENELLFNFVFFIVLWNFSLITWIMAIFS